MPCPKHRVFQEGKKSCAAAQAYQLLKNRYVVPVFRSAHTRNQKHTQTCQVKGIKSAKVALYPSLQHYLVQRGSLSNIPLHTVGWYQPSHHRIDLEQSKEQQTTGPNRGRGVSSGTSISCLNISRSRGGVQGSLGHLPGHHRAVVVVPGRQESLGHKPSGAPGTLTQQGTSLQAPHPTDSRLFCRLRLVQVRCLKPRPGRYHRWVQPATGTIPTIVCVAKITMSGIGRQSIQPHYQQKIG